MHYDHPTLNHLLLFIITFVILGVLQYIYIYYWIVVDLIALFLCLPSLLSWAGSKEPAGWKLSWLAQAGPGADYPPTGCRDYLRSRL